MGKEINIKSTNDDGEYLERTLENRNDLKY